MKRSIETLGLTSPLDQLVNLERVGQDVRASTIVAGEVIDYRVKQVGGGKQAIVAVRMVAYDVSSGLPVNGALEKGESTIRSGNVTNDALIVDAIQQAAAIGVRTMQGQQLPSATVLNTTTQHALINQGTRSGFKSGDSVIITRGSLQVGTGRIGQIEPDQAEMTPERVLLGLAPGDRVRAVFNPPALPAAGVGVFTNEDNLRVASKPKGHSNNATLISALLVVGLVAVLLGSGGNSNGTNATSNFSAQATLDPGTGFPAVFLKWSTNGFYKGNGNLGNGTAHWQVFRTDISTNPILIFDGTARSGLDSSSGSQGSLITSGYFSRTAITTGLDTTKCNGSEFTNAAVTEVPLSQTTALRSYQYSIELVYSVLGLDLPDGTTGQASSGTTSGTTSTSSGSTSTTSGSTSTTSGSTSTTSGSTSTTSGATSAGSTATAGGTSASGGTTANGGTTAGGSGSTQDCYFLSSRTGSGLATPFPRPVLTTRSGSASNMLFNFTSAFTPGAVVQEEIIEFSDSQLFPKGHTVTRTASAFGSTSITAATMTGDFATTKGLGGTLLSAVQTLYYRVGVRNINDRPGPLPDQYSGKRYIYSLPGSFARAGTTPGTP